MLVTIPTQCPNCGGSLPDQAAFCPACGTRLAYPQQPSGENQDLELLVENANQTLLKSGNGAAEYAFGMGCFLAAILIVGLLLALFLLGLRDMTTLGVVTVIAVLAAAMAAAFLAMRARNATLATTYRKVVQPEIDVYLRAHQLTRQEFDDRAAEMVASGEPLSRFLSPTPELESEA